jgi:hypothetical protein
MTNHCVKNEDFVMNSFQDNKWNSFQDNQLQQQALDFGERYLRKKW